MNDFSIFLSWGLFSDEIHDIQSENIIENPNSFAI